MDISTLEKKFRLHQTVRQNLLVLWKLVVSKRQENALEEELLLFTGSEIRSCEINTHIYICFFGFFIVVFFFFSPFLI